MVIRNHFKSAIFPLLLLLFFAGNSLTASAESAEITLARTALLHGRVDEAVSTLKPKLAAQPGDALAHQLLCRAYYAQDLASQAVQECQLAVSNAPTNSESQMWLGRAYGLKASHASPFTALGLARRVHQAFERAVEMNPENVYAYSDLGEFYVAAPGLVGGGIDKAKALADRMMAHFPAQSHRLLALIAGRQNDKVTQEAEFKNAVSVSKSAAALIDLARFYQEHGDPDLALSTIHSAIAADHARDASLVDAAGVLTAARRAPDLAERCLREYLASPAMSDEAPAFKVHLQLGNLLAQRGDIVAAREQYNAAAALASTYAPARKAIQST